jgi:hypothetical protein
LTYAERSARFAAEEGIAAKRRKKREKDTAEKSIEGHEERKAKNLRLTSLASRYMNNPSLASDITIRRLALIVIVHTAESRRGRVDTLHMNLELF